MTHTDIHLNPRSAPGPTRLVDYSEMSCPLQFLQDLFTEHGDVVRYQTRFGPCFLFAHPDHVQAIFRCDNYRRASLVKMVLGEGLLASDGQIWRSHRQLMQRDFAPRRVAPFLSLMLRETERTANEWQRAAVCGADVDVAGSMTQLTLRIVVAALFSADLSDEQSARLCAAVTQVITELGRISWTIFGAPVLFTPHSTREFRDAKAVIDEVCCDMIARRQGTPAERRPRDLLTMLIESRIESGSLDDRELRDEMVTMLIGGHETTALALSWTWKALAENPQIEKKLHDEVDLVLPDVTANASSVSQLNWTRAVFQETMRLYPPVWYVGRVAINDGVIGGYSIPRGACVLVSAWVTHRHTGFWSEPEKFAPERFLEGGPRLNKDAYIPFGGGRHTCLGMHFGVLEGTLILSHLSQRFRVEPLSGEIRANPGITLRQSPGLRARIKLRRDKTDADCRSATC
jgi:cytochrome P450